ncbi:MAG: T9SS type A sorting domain-containing protein [candidate division Zixibacteria bacterium]|nr:T9SS type A sorting domain-containing protein [candidate division Zixibacteria bacterium]
MSKLITVLILITAFVSASSTEPSQTMPIVEYEFSTGNEPLPEGPVYPYQPGTITDSPGTIVGYTIYDQQTNGSTGNRIAICDDGSKYFCWMSLLDYPYPPATRHVYYNWVDPQGNWFAEGEGGQVSENSGSGYTNLDVMDNNIGAIFYHWSSGVSENYVSTEWDPPGMGFFTHNQAPNEVFPQTPNSPGIIIWPYGTVDNNNNIHMVATENTSLRMQRMGYTRSVDSGLTWTDVELVDTVMVLGSVIDASPVSDKVVVAYSKTRDTTSQWENDIAYIASDDGLTWDFHNDIVNITNYYEDDDSLLAYTDLDVIIDYDDYVHAVWNAQWITDEGIYYRTYLFHYSEETGQITEICHRPDSSWYSMEGAWNRSVCKMNMGVFEIPGGPDGIFVTWSQFDTSDVSNGGFGNSEIYMAYSADGGTIWSEPLNLTNSITPGCVTGECDSDHWSSLADVVDDSLHIIYINDKDAGSISKEEGAATVNPVRYLTYPNPLTTGIDNELDALPAAFRLGQNYPNPFNANTEIPFEIYTAGDISLDVFDLTGAKVANLVDEYLKPGLYQFTWYAGHVGSGIYYYKLRTGNKFQTKKGVLIK